MLHLKNAVPGGKTILAPTQIDELHKPLVATGSPDESYGMGWQMWRPGGHTAALYHPGGQVGVSSEFLLLPDHNAAVILLSNRKTGRAFLTRTRDRLLRTVVPNWNGLPTSVPAPVRPAWPPKSYGGVWRGKLFVPGGSLWAALTVAADATSAQFAVGDTGGRPLKDFGLSDGLISGHVTLPIPAADELRFDVREVEISLKLRGNQMDGEAVAYKLTSKQMTILPHRLVLRREP